MLFLKALERPSCSFKLFDRLIVSPFYLVVKIEPWDSKSAAWANDSTNTLTEWLCCVLSRALNDILP